MMNNMDLSPWPNNQMKGAETAAMEYQALYPEIYYQLQPYVVEACDQMECSGATVPTKNMIQMLGDKIESQFGFSDMDASSMTAFTGTPGALRSRGLFRDLLDILLLQELFGRRRRYYY